MAPIARSKMTIMTGTKILKIKIAEGYPLGLIF